MLAKFVRSILLTTTLFQHAFCDVVYIKNASYNFIPIGSYAVSEVRICVSLLQINYLGANAFKPIPLGTQTYCVFFNLQSNVTASSESGGGFPIYYITAPKSCKHHDSCPHDICCGNDQCISTIDGGPRCLKSSDYLINGLFIGDDYGLPMILPVYTACKQMCVETPECVAYVYNTLNSVCQRKTTITFVMRLDDVYSGEIKR